MNFLIPSQLSQYEWMGLLGGIIGFGFGPLAFGAFPQRGCSSCGFERTLSGFTHFPSGIGLVKFYNFTYPVKPPKKHFLIRKLSIYSGVVVPKSCTKTLTNKRTTIIEKMRRL